MILQHLKFGTLPALVLFVMSYEDPDMLDYVDEDYDWNRGIAEPEDSGDVDAEFLALLEVKTPLLGAHQYSVEI